MNHRPFSQLYGHSFEAYFIALLNRLPKAKDGVPIFSKCTRIRTHYSCFNVRSYYVNVFLTFGALTASTFIFFGIFFAINTVSSSTISVDKTIPRCRAIRPV